MVFNTQDKQDYLDYLENEIKTISKLPENIHRNFYLDNLYADMKDIKKQLNK